MDAVVDLSWRAYPAAALMALGLLLTVRAVRTCHAAWRRPLSQSMRPLGWMQGFRLTMIGLALIGVGAAWWWQIGWLLALSLAIGGEETLESSIVISALSRAQQPHRLGAAAGQTAPAPPPL
jgi:hypothetical protein